MLRIPCPHCGVRDETEYVFGGPTHVLRPAFEVSDVEWTDYLFNRNNPRGLHYERWCHTYGCSQWFNVARDTQTHEILLTYRLQDSMPQLDRAGAPKRAC
jgi:sarcosine oxidase, subunit delta